MFSSYFLLPVSDFNATFAQGLKNYGRNPQAIYKQDTQETLATYEKNGVDYYVLTYNKRPSNLPSKYSHTTGNFIDRIFDVQSARRFLVDNITPQYPFKWTQLPDIPFEGRDSGAFAVLNGKAYLLGGWNPDFPNPPRTQEFWQFDGTWTQLPDLPFDQPHAACLAYNGKLWMIGGGFKDKSWSWSPRTGIWEVEDVNIPTLDNRIGFQFGVTSDNCIIIVGGNGSFWHDTVLKSDNTGHNWTILPQLSPFGACYAGNVNRMPMLNGELGLIGGGLIYNYMTPKLWTTRDGVTWTDRGASPLKSWWPNAITFDDKVIWIGGHTMSRVDTNKTIYTTDWVNFWDMDVPFPAKHAGALFKIGDYLYYVTGRADGVMTKDFWRLQIN